MSSGSVAGQAGGTSVTLLSKQKNRQTNTQCAGEFLLCCVVHRASVAKINNYTHKIYLLTLQRRSSIEQERAETSNRFMFTASAINLSYFLACNISVLRI